MISDRLAYIRDPAYIQGPASINTITSDLGLYSRPGLYLRPGLYSRKYGNWAGQRVETVRPLCCHRVSSNQYTQSIGCPIYFSVAQEFYIYLRFGG